MKTVTFKITYDDKDGYKGHGEDITELIQSGIKTFMEIDLEGDGVIKKNWTVEAIETPCNHTFDRERLERDFHVTGKQCDNCQLIQKSGTIYG